MLRTAPLFAVLFVCFGTAGCARKGPVPVKGVVQLDGKPLAGASVLFLSQSEGGRDARGSADAAGVFHLTTAQLHDGAFPGSYKIIVQPPTPENVGAVAPTFQQAQQGEIASRPKHAAIILPSRYSQPDQTILTQEVPTTGDVLIDLHSR